MSTTLLALTVLLAPQAPAVARAAAEPVFAVHRGVLGERGVEFARLGLGDGGVGARRDSHTDVHGGHVTAGGVLVRAQPQGVKFDFPNGADFVVDTRGAIRLRGGEATPPHHNGLRIALGAGAVVEIVPPGRESDPLRHVEVREGGRATALWRHGAVLTWSPEARAAREIALVALGDGRVLYRGGVLGPIVGFERVLCPNELATTTPAQFVGIVGDVLARSLADLAFTASRRLATEPQLVQRANGLARAAAQLFLRGDAASRPAGATGELLIPLDEGVHLAIPPRPAGDLALDLWITGADLPECEWVVGTRTLLHLLIRNEAGEPRYAMQGVDLSAHLVGLLPIEASSDGAALVRRLITARR